MVSPLDTKLMRDFVRLWAQALAIALVAAAGVMTLVLGVGTQRSLGETQQAYYDRYSFADIFATATRVPDAVTDEILSILGVARADTRIAQQAVLDIAGMAEPASSLILSIPDLGEPQLNRLFLIAGSLPDPARNGEIAISKAFADAHNFAPGDKLSAIMGGVKHHLMITAIVLSPEFIYSVGGGEIVPDDRRFGIIWMRQSHAAAVFDLVGAFNSVALQINTDAREFAVIDALDDILKPYGGRGAYGRAEQTSHAFLSSELTQLEAMSYVLPPIFLGVAAFLVNMILSRLIALEREQIGLLKALGYPSRTIAIHYLKLALAIAAIGTVLGWLMGAWAGRGLASVYADFFKFPFLLYQDRPDVFAISGLAAMTAATIGSLQAVKSVLSLSPAVAMAPPAPAKYRQFILDKLGVTRHLPQGFTMAIRNLTRRPTRATLTALGIALSTGLLVGGLFTEDSLEFMIDATFFHSERQHATLSFAQPVPPSALETVNRLPGVIDVEPFRSVPVSLSNGLKQKRAGLVGKPTSTDLSRIVDSDLNPISLPHSGLALSEMMAEVLDVQVGDTVDVEILDGSEKELSLPVSQIMNQFMGLGAYMELSALNRTLGEGSFANGAYLSVDTTKTDELYQAVKDTPAILGVSLQRKSLEMFRATIGENIGISRGVYVALAVIIVFGVVYNSMRIQLSERARELASIRVLGFSNAEVSVILLSELTLITLIAIPLGWLLGYGMALSIAEGFKTELFSFPLIIERATYAVAGLVVLGAAVVSAYFVQRRVARLDMIAVLKTRD